MVRVQVLQFYSIRKSNGCAALGLHLFFDHSKIFNDFYVLFCVICFHYSDALQSGAGQTSKNTCTSRDLSGSCEQRRTVAADAPQSITYSVLPRLMRLLAEQSCTSYRPGVRPAVTAEPHRQRAAVHRMQRASRMAAIISRFKTTSKQ